MRNYLTGPALLSGLAAALVAGTADPGFAFQETDRPIITQSEADCPGAEDRTDQEGQDQAIQDRQRQDRIFQDQQRQNRAIQDQQRQDRIIQDQQRNSLLPGANDERRVDPQQGPMGQFTSLHQGKVTIQGQGDETQSFETNEQTQVLLDGRPAELNALRKGDQIQVIAGPGGAALRVIATRQPGQPGLQFQRNQTQPGKQLQANQQTQPGAVERREAGFRGQADDPNADERITNQNNREQARTAWMGLMLRDAEDQRGVNVVRTYPSGPAARAGIYSGDVILQIGQTRVSSADEITQALNQVQPNEQVEVVILRDKTEHTLPVTVGSRADFLGEIQEEPRRTQRADNQEQEFDDSTIPEHAMMLEQHRRLAEQHQRIEEKLDMVLKELEQLKKQMGVRQQRGAGFRGDIEDVTSPRDPRPIEVEDAPRNPRDATEAIEETPRDAAEEVEEAVEEVEEAAEDAPEVTPEDIEIPDSEKVEEESID